MDIGKGDGTTDIKSGLNDKHKENGRKKIEDPEDEDDEDMEDEEEDEEDDLDE